MNKLAVLRQSLYRIKIKMVECSIPAHDSYNIVTTAESDYLLLYAELSKTTMGVYGNVHSQSFVGGSGAVFMMLPASRNSTISLFPATSFTTANAPFV
jgi:hypothetical protein